MLTQTERHRQKGVLTGDSVKADTTGKQVVWHGYGLQVLAMANGQLLAYFFQQTTWLYD